MATAGASAPSSSRCAPRCRPPVPRTRRRSRTGGPRPSSADDGRRSRVVDVHEPRRPREERLHRDLDPRRQHAAHVLALGRDDVEVRGRAEVDHDDRGAVPLLRGDGVHDAVRTDLARVVVADRDAGLHAGPTTRIGAWAHFSATSSIRGSAPAPSRRGRSRPRTRSRGARPAARRARRRSKIAAVASRQCSLSAAAGIQAERGLRVAHVDSQQHRRQ